MSRVMLYTKKQAAAVLAAWGCSEPVPNKGQAVVVCHGPAYGNEVSRVAITALRSDSGERLYQAETGQACEIFPTGAPA